MFEEGTIKLSSASFGRRRGERKTEEMEKFVDWLWREYKPPLSVMAKPSPTPPYHTMGVSVEVEGD
jgi:hypothetical protein